MRHDGTDAPEDAVARFLGMLEGSAYAGLAIGAAVSALLIEWVRIRGALVISGAFLPVLVLVLLRPLAAIDRGPLVSRDRLELILRVPMFEPLSPEDVERLTSQLQPIVAEEGTAVIRQGDVGDRFYVLAEGRAEASVDGTAVPVYEPGDGFGEIALLHDVPRTASVRVVTLSRITALDRAHFLSVLTDEPASMIAAERLAADRLLDTAAQQRET